MNAFDFFHFIFLTEVMLDCEGRPTSNVLGIFYVLCMKNNKTMGAQTSHAAHAAAPAAAAASAHNRAMRDLRRAQDRAQQRRYERGVAQRRRAAAFSKGGASLPSFASMAITASAAGAALDMFQATRKKAHI